MANILLTNHCNRSCPYCFAKARLTSTEKTSTTPLMDMSWEDLLKVTDFLKRSQIKEFRMLGGEPTLHPRFIDICKHALENGFDLKLFTNGIMNDEQVAFLKGLAPGHLLIILNLNEPALQTPYEAERVDVTLRELKHCVTLGFTIFEKNFNLGYIFDTIEKYGLMRRIRLGFSSPILGAENKYVPTSEYPEVGTRIVSFAEEGLKRGILLGFDCGFALCCFTSEQIGRMFYCNAEFKFICDIIVDIGPNLEVWSCFPLSQVHRTHLDQFKDYDAVVEFYRGKFRPYRSFGCLDQCTDCNNLGRNCAGGCLSYTIKNFQPSSPLIS